MKSSPSSLSISMMACLATRRRKSLLRRIIGRSAKFDRSIGQKVIGMVITLRSPAESVTLKFRLPSARFKQNRRDSSFSFSA
ncbi:hypothetical protein D3C72_2320890 [compost metagenome]